MKPFVAKDHRVDGILRCHAEVPYVQHGGVVVPKRWLVLVRASRVREPPFRPDARPYRKPVLVERERLQAYVAIPDRVSVAALEMPDRGEGVEKDHEASGGRGCPATPRA